MAIDTLVREGGLTDALRLDDLRLRRLGVTDVEAAGWGTSWQPEDRTQLTWSDVEEWREPEEEGLLSSDAWDLWPLIERLGQSRWPLVGP